MNLLKKFKNSIKRIIIINYIFVVLTIITGVVITNWIQIIIDDKHHQFVDVNGQIANLPILIERNKINFTNYIRQGRIEDLKEYQLLNQEIAKKLNLINTDKSMNDFTVMSYHGSLERMYMAQNKLSNNIIESGLLTLDDYDSFLYVSELFKYMVLQANHLTTSYLDFSSNEYTKMTQKSKQIQAFIFVGIIILACISIVIGIYLLGGIFKTLNTLSVQSKLLSQKKWDIEDLKKVPYFELNNVIQAFNQMKHNIKHNIEELKQKSSLEKKLHTERLLNFEKEKLLRSTQIKSLQMQMNPHFLFNTLNMISRTIKLNKTETSVQLIESTSNILRYNLRMKNNYVFLNEELSALKSYVYVQQQRFQERIHFTIKNEVSLQKIELPPLILQPLVENAIVHGLSNVVKGGKIIIKLSVDSNFLNISVKDNGNGMSKIEVENFLYKGDSSKSNGIALNNIKKRLSLLYGNNYLFNINSSLGKGTEVQLILPTKRG